jgi:hypothetical protein
LPSSTASDRLAVVASVAKAPASLCASQVPVRGLVVELELTDEPIERSLGMGDHR